MLVAKVGSFGVKRDGMRRSVGKMGNGKGNMEMRFGSSWVLGDNIVETEE